MIIDSPLSVHLEDGATSQPTCINSTYLPLPLALSDGSFEAHALSLVICGPIGKQALRGRLIADPNERPTTPATGHPPREPLSRNVAFTRLYATDQGYAECDLYAITGMDMPLGLSLVVSPHKGHYCLRLGDRLVLMSPAADSER